MAGFPRDPLITAAARALAAGDPLGALKRVALRDDAPALALRGIAMAQLGDLIRAKALLRSAERAFGPREAVARARCIVAEAEIALVSRDLGFLPNALDTARATLEAHGDRVNAAHARYLEVRRLLLIGRLDEAERALAELDPASLPPASRTAHELLAAGIAIRRLRTKAARAALARAERAARQAQIPGADGRSRERGPRPEHARCAPDCARRRATPPARGGRRIADIESLRRGRVPPCRASRRQGGLARNASGVVRAGSRASRGVAGRRSQGHARCAGIPSQARR